jgi:hypothetical protein
MWNQNPHSPHVHGQFDYNQMQNRGLGLNPAANVFVNSSSSSLGVSSSHASPNVFNSMNSGSFQQRNMNSLSHGPNIPPSMRYSSNTAHFNASGAPSSGSRSAVVDDDDDDDDDLDDDESSAGTSGQDRMSLQPPLSSLRKISDVDIFQKLTAPGFHASNQALLDELLPVLFNSASHYSPFASPGMKVRAHLA